MSAVEEATEVGTLTLHALDFDPEPECDWNGVECRAMATWRITCRVNGCWGMVCEAHMLAVKLKQERENLRRGQRCICCGAEGNDLLRFDPIIAPDGARLW